MSDVSVTDASTQASAEMDVSSETSEATRAEAQLGNANDSAQALAQSNRDSSEASMVDQASDHVPDIVHEIIPEGDLILLAGRDRTKIQVTRHLLCKASPVFVDLLERENIIGEGSSRERDTPFELELLEDDPVVVRIAFDILYVPSSTTHNLIPEEIYNVILFAFKYGMLESFEYPAAYWFRYASPNTLDSLYGPGDCWYLMMSAYWMGLSADFFEFSARLVAETSDSLFGYVSRSEHREHRIRELTIWWAIRERRIAVHRSRWHGNHPTHVGICLNCFETATGWFPNTSIHRLEGCPNPGLHPLGP